jgi:hypothetical protein
MVSEVGFVVLFFHFLFLNYYLLFYYYLYIINRNSNGDISAAVACLQREVKPLFMLWSLDEIKTIHYIYHRHGVHIPLFKKELLHKQWKDTLEYLYKYNAFSCHFVMDNLSLCLILFVCLVFRFLQNSYKFNYMCSDKYVPDRPCFPQEGQSLDDVECSSPECLSVVDEDEDEKKDEEVDSLGKLAGTDNLFTEGISGMGSIIRLTIPATAPVNSGDIPCVDEILVQ